MYNRYIPSENGTYHRERVESDVSELSAVPTPLRNEPPRQEQTPKPSASGRGDSDELLLVVILLLLLMDDRDEDLSVLIAALAFLIL